MMVCLFLADFVIDQTHDFGELVASTNLLRDESQVLVVEPLTLGCNELVDLPVDTLSSLSCPELSKKTV